jgi:aconitate hydratase
MAFDIEMKKVYDNMASRVDAAREIVGHPMTLRENFIQSLMGWVNKLMAEGIMLTLLQIE